MNKNHIKGAIARNKLLHMHFNAKVGHVGGNISCLDALIVLFHNIMGEEDRFVLSEGHSAGALYAPLWSMGKLSDEDLNSFCKDNITPAN